MSNFVDPRIAPAPSSETPSVRTTQDPDALEELQQLCRDGRIYEVERWIQEGKPLQLAEGTNLGRRRWSSALKIALEDGNHGLVLLLLCNGFDPRLEGHCPLDQPLRDRRFDLVDLLLEWGADPHRVSLHELFGTYKTELFERFRSLGVDLTAGHALASALAHHTSNTPLYGFAKQRRKDNPEIQTELNIALGHHADEGNERGVGLCLWAGADPHAPAPSLRRWDDSEEEDQFTGFSAVRKACSSGSAEVLEALGPDPEQDDFDDLYASADSRLVVEHLADIALPEDGDRVIRRQIRSVAFSLRGPYRSYASLSTLEQLFEVGVRWESSSREDIGRTRRSLIKAPDRTFVRVMKLLATEDYCSPDVRHELARTSAIQRRMKEVGFIPSEERKSGHTGQRRPTQSREVLKKFGIGLKQKPQPDRALPQAVHIGRWRSEGKGIRMDREELFDRVWSTPVSTLSEKWGLSGRGLSKACNRLRIPTPPRGYWQKRKAGKDVSRPDLPKLPDGQAEEVVIWTNN